MPIYEYECPSCRARFELKQSFSAEPVSSCPECQTLSRRVFQPVGIVFKGSGWYITDSRGKSEAVSPSEPSSGNGDSSSKRDASKPEAESPKAAESSAPKTEAKSTASGSSS